jgi:AAHS family benzoate transporter-like MFS transporter
LEIINVKDSLDNSKFNRFHLLVMCWCFFIIMFDGYDLIIYGSVLPELMKEWNMSAIQAGAIGSYALIGMMIGALIFGTLADKIGRRNVIIISTLLFSLFSALSSFANDPSEFGFYRFLTGLGLGGSLPNVFALMTEYAPKRMRTIIVAIMSTGFPLGGILAASLSIYLLPVYGWQSLFLIGALPLLAVPFMYKFIPESISYYVLHKNKERISLLLTKIDPFYRPHPKDKYELNLPEKSGLPVISLFQNGRVLGTLMIWIVVFMNLLMLFGLNTWLPKLMMAAGYPLGSSLTFLLVLNVGAILGPVLGGWVADRWKTKNVLIIYFLLAGVSIVLLGLKTEMFLLYSLVFIAGATTIGSQPITNTFIVQYYPFNMRSTGIGWALGIGRLGGIVGAALGGLLISMNLSFQVNFMIFAIPGLLAALALLFISTRTSSSQ